MVDLLPTEEQLSISDTVARFLADGFPVERLVTSEADPAAREAGWAAIAEIGCLGIGLGEDHGGAGMSLVEEMLVAQEFGRVVGPTELLSAMLAARLAAACGVEAIAQGIAAGTLRVATLSPITPVEMGTGLSGDFYLLDHQQADVALFVGEGGAMLFPMASLTPQPAEGLDAFVPLARIALRGAEPSCVRLEPMWWRQALLLAAAYLSGITQAACAMASDYAKLRHQFGRPIGSFQAVKHRCVDMAIGAEAIGSQIAFAALVIGGDAPDATFQAMSAKFVAAQNAIRSAQDNIQLHGAIGTTAELPAHLYLKRAHLVDRLFGSSRLLGDRLLASDGPYTGFED